MGNLCSISFSCDAIAMRCWDDCIRGEVKLISGLDKNLDHLKESLEKLTATRDDVNNGQQSQWPNKLLYLWLKRVKAEETQVPVLINERGNLSVGGCFFKDFKGTHEIAGRVAKKLEEVKELISEGEVCTKEGQERNMMGNSGQIVFTIETIFALAGVKDEHVRIVGVHVLVFAVLNSIIILKGTLFSSYVGFLTIGCVISFCMGCLVSKLGFFLYYFSCTRSKGNRQGARRRRCPICTY